MIDIINEILFWVCLYVLLWYGYILLVNRGVPNIKTAPAMRRRMTEIFQKDMGSKQGGAYRIVDLGSGNGDLTRHLARTLPDAHIIGVEISPIAYYRSVLLQKLFGIKNLEYRKMSFVEFSLTDINGVVVYQLPSSLYHLKPKFTGELKPGALIIANRFELGDPWIPFETQEVDTLAFKQKYLYLYRR